MRQISSGCGSFYWSVEESVLMHGLLDFPCHTVFAVITHSKSQRVSMGLYARAG